MSLLNDIKNFYKVIGGLDELSERGLIKTNDLNNKNHEKYLKKLIKKYNIKYKEEKDLEENILNMEAIIDEEFTNILVKL